MIGPYSGNETPERQGPHPRRHGGVSPVSACTGPSDGAEISPTITVNSLKFYACSTILPHSRVHVQ
jgi:hypothetical protein